MRKQRERGRNQKQRKSSRICQKIIEKEKVGRFSYKTKAQKELSASEKIESERRLEDFFKVGKNKEACSFSLESQKEERR